MNRHVAPTLRRFAGRCPPRGLNFLGAAKRKFVASTLPHFISSLPPEGANFPRGGPSGNSAATLRRWSAGI